MHASFTIFKVLEDNCAFVLQNGLPNGEQTSGAFHRIHCIMFLVQAFASCAAFFFTHVSGVEHWRVWHEAFQLGAYESLNYFSHLQSLQGMPSQVTPTHHMLTGLVKAIKHMRQSCAALPTVGQACCPPDVAPGPAAATAYSDRSVPFTLGQSLFRDCKGSDTQCLLHIVSESIHPPISGADSPASLSWTIGNGSRLQHSPTFRTAFAKRRRFLELKMNASEEESVELAAIYRFQSLLDGHDRLLGKAPPIPLSGSPDFSISNSSSIAVYPRMDRSLVLGFTSVVDSMQLNMPDGRQLLWMQSVNAAKGSGSFVEVLEPLCKLPGNPALPSYVDSRDKLPKMWNISEASKKSLQIIEASAPPSKHVTHPVLMQRFAEATSILPLAGALPQKLLNCYEVSLLNVNVHSKVATMISDKRLSQTLLSDPNQFSQDTTAETVRQKEFSESMLSIMHDHPKSAHVVRAYRHSFAARRSLRVVFSHALLLILIIALALSTSSGPEVSALVQFIRKQVFSTDKAPSLIRVSDFQSNVKQLAPLLWLHCDTDPSSCGMSRLGSVRVTQWRRSSLAEAPCFSSSQFTQSCMGSGITVPGAAPQTTLSFARGNAAIGQNGEIVVLLNSSATHEGFWDDLFKPDSLFFTAETAKIQVEATLFSPKLQHFVSFQITALFESGLSQSRCLRHTRAGVSCCISDDHHTPPHSLLSVTKCTTSPPSNSPVPELASMLPSYASRCSQFWLTC